MAYAAGDYAFTLNFVERELHPWSITGAVVLVSGTPTPAEVAFDVGEAWGTELMPGLSTAENLVSVTAKDLFTNELGLADVGVAGEIGSGTTLPLGVCMVLTLRTALYSKSGRGRMYVSGLTDASLGSSDTSRWDDTATADIQNRLAAFNATLGDGSLTSGNEYALAVHSRLLAALNVVTSITVDQLIDQQRRRLRD